VWSVKIVQPIQRANLPGLALFFVYNVTNVLTFKVIFGILYAIGGHKVYKMKKVDTAAAHERLIEDIQSICLKHGVSTPGAFLTEVMCGIDPRQSTAPLYDLVCSIARAERLPNEAEWTELLDLVLNSPVYKTSRTELMVSIRAAEKIIEYMFPKLKSFEVSSNNTSVNIGPISKEDMAAVAPWFNENF